MGYDVLKVFGIPIYNFLFLPSIIFLSTRLLSRLHYIKIGFFVACLSFFFVISSIFTLLFSLPPSFSSHAITAILYLTVPLFAYFCSQSITLNDLRCLALAYQSFYKLFLISCLIYFVRVPFFGFYAPSIPLLNRNGSMNLLLILCLITQLSYLLDSLLCSKRLTKLNYRYYIPPTFLSLIGLLSQSRTVFLSSLLILLYPFICDIAKYVFLALKSQRILVTRSLILVSATLFLTFGILAVNTSLFSRYSKIMESLNVLGSVKPEQLVVASALSGDNSFDVQRTSMVLVATSVIKKNPLFGSGAGLVNYKAAVSKTDLNVSKQALTSKPHSLILLWSSEFGLIGLFLLSLIIYFSIFHFTFSCAEPLSIFIQSVAVVSVLNSLVNQYYFVAPLWILFICMVSSSKLVNKSILQAQPSL